MWSNSIQWPRMATRNSNPTLMPLQSNYGSSLGITGGEYIAFWYATIVTKCQHILNRFLNQKIQSGVPGPTQAILFSYNCAQDSKVKKEINKIKWCDKALGLTQHANVFMWKPSQDQAPSYFWVPYCPNYPSTWGQSCSLLWYLDSRRSMVNHWCRGQFIIQGCK